MLSSAELANKLEAAIVSLESAYATAKKSDKSRIARLRNVFWAQLEKLAGVPVGADVIHYLTAEFSGAANRVQKIIEDRDKFNSSITTAAELFNTLSAVAAILAVL